MKITRAQAEALAAFIIRVRADWRQAGVSASMEKCPDEYPLDIARALINLAADATVQTPGLLHSAGPHWLRPDGKSTPRKGDNNIPCPEHTGQTMPCRRCTEGTRPPTPDELAEIREAYQAKGRERREERAEIEKRRAGA